MFKWILLVLYLALLGVVSSQHIRPPHVPHRRVVRGQLGPASLEEEVKYDNVPQKLATKPARLRTDLPIFELIYGQNTDYELGRALEGSVLVRGRPLTVWSYDVQPDLSRFSWMVYDRKRRVLSGTPPVAQPPPIHPDTLSYLDVYIYMGNDRSYRLRTVLGIFIHPRNDSIPPDTSPPATSAGIPASPDQQVSRPHGVILGMLIAACILLLLLALGGLVWIIAARRHLQNRAATTQSARDSDHSSEPSGSITPRGRRSDSHAYPPSSSSAITWTRRRVRTADHGATPALQLSPGRSLKNTPEKSSLAGTRKRAATLLQTIHTRAIRGSPRIGSNSKGTLAPSPEVAGTHKSFSPRLGFGQVSPRVGSHIKKDGEVEERQFTNSWCSALQLDPFQSLGLSTDLTKLGSQEGYVERPTSPTPNRGISAAGHRTMSVSELQSSGSAAEKSIDSASGFDYEGDAFCANTLSPAPTDSYTEDTPVPKSNRILPTQSFSGRSMAGILTRDQSYAERTTQLGIALLTPPENMHTSKPAHGSMGLSFDSFFSPAAIETDGPVIQREETSEPRYGDVSSERMVKIGRSQETLATVYVTASETGASPVNLGRETSSGGHGVPENIGIIGSPSTLHSQMAELDDISSPISAQGPEVTALAGGPETSVEGSSQSLSVEYGRADQSLRPLDSFPAMLRGSLLSFPEDVELNTPVLPSSGRSELGHREASDIMLLPADDLTLGCIMLTRVGDEQEGLDERDAEQRASSITSAKDSIMSTHEGPSSHAEARTEDSILSPDPSERASDKEDSILGHDQNARNSADSILSKEADRSSNGLRYASQLFVSPKDQS